MAMNLRVAPGLQRELLACGIFPAAVTNCTKVSKATPYLDLGACTELRCMHCIEEPSACNQRLHHVPSSKQGKLCSGQSASKSSGNNLSKSSCCSCFIP